jgi:hypothetical protein
MALTIADVEQFFAEDPEAAAHYVPASKHAEELDHLKKSQSGSDRTVKELQARIRELETAARPDEILSAAFDDLKRRENELNLQKSAYKIAAEKNVPLDVALSMVSDESSLQKIGGLADYIETVKKNAFDAGAKQGAQIAAAAPRSGSTDINHYSRSVLEKMSVGEASQKFRNDPRFRSAWSKHTGGRK